jgi:tetratricopeptide (TPR) repeat protein
MKVLAHNIIVFILLSNSLQLNTSYRTEIYSAYVNNKMDLWRDVIDRMDTIPEKSNDLLLELVNYQYGYIGYCTGFDKKEEAKNYLDLAQRNIEILEKCNFKLSVINSYKAAFYGFRIGLNPISAPVNGFRSIDCAKMALNLDSANYLAYVQYGNMKFYMPSALGGSKKVALEYYLKARDLLEKETDSITGNWNYLSLLVVLGQTYTYLNDYLSAQKVYDNILKIEPEFFYVKDDLYPKLLKKMENLN